MKRIYRSLFVLGLLFSLNSYAQTASKNQSITHLDKIIAIVDRGVITQSQLNKEMEQTRKQLEHLNQPLPTSAELRKQVLDHLIGKTLQLQLAKTKGTKVTTDDLETTMQNIAKANKISAAQLKEAVEQSGLSYADYTAQLQEQILLQKLQQEEVAKTISLTPDDVKKFVQENKAKFNQYSAFHVIDILLPAAETADSNQIALAKKQALQIAKQLQSNNDIDAVLRQYPSAEKNDLGWRSLADIPSLFQPKVASLHVNNISPPLQAPNGVHLLKLVEVKGENLNPTETQLKNLAFQQKMAEAVKIWVQKLRNDSYVQIMK